MEQGQKSDSLEDVPQFTEVRWALMGIIKKLPRNDHLEKAEACVYSAPPCQMPASILNSSKAIK